MHSLNDESSDHGRKLRAQKSEPACQARPVESTETIDPPVALSRLRRRHRVMDDSMTEAQAIMTTQRYHAGATCLRGCVFGAGMLTIVLGISVVAADRG